MRTIPSRQDVRLREAQTLAYLASQGSQDVIVVGKTFLNVPLPTRQAQSVIQTTTEAHGGTNPRRRIAEPIVS